MKELCRYLKEEHFRKGISKCKGPEVGAATLCSRIRKKINLKKKKKRPVWVEASKQKGEEKENRSER